MLLGKSVGSDLKSKPILPLLLRRQSSLDSVSVHCELHRLNDHTIYAVRHCSLFHTNRYTVPQSMPKDDIHYVNTFPNSCLTDKLLDV